MQISDVSVHIGGAVWGDVGAGLEAESVLAAMEKSLGQSYFAAHALRQIAPIARPSPASAIANLSLGSASNAATAALRSPWVSSATAASIGSGTGVGAPSDAGSGGGGSLSRKPCHCAGGITA